MCSARRILNAFFVYRARVVLTRCLLCFFCSVLPQSHAYLRYFVLNPLFAKRTRHLLKELLRIGRHTQLFHRVFPTDLVQPVLADMVQVRRQIFFRFFEDFFAIFFRDFLFCS